MAFQVSKPEYDVVVSLDLLIPMRDGVRLVCDVYRPARDGEPLPGPFPVMLERTPYGKHDLTRRRDSGEYWARRGYAAVLQDCRGCHASEGELNFLTQEAEDGYDTLAWIGSQPWCNGKVGTHGTSYAAWTQSAPACLNPPHLAAMWPNFGGSHAYFSSVRQGGALELRFFCWAFWHAAVNTNAALRGRPGATAALNSADIRAWLTRLPIKPGQSPLALAPNYQRWLFDIYTRSDYSDFWKQPSLGIAEHWDGHADVPIYLSGGWYDSYTRATLENFVGLTARKKGPVKVIMGPWTHGGRTPEQPYAGDVEFGPEAAVPDFRELQLAWFDQWLKGEETGIASEPPLKLFVMGGGGGHRTKSGRLFHGGRWRAEQEWPLARTRSTNYYLQPGGGLSSHRPPPQESYSRYVFDPTDPVPTIGGNVSSLSALRPVPAGVADPTTLPQTMRVEQIVTPGGYDQRERPDIFGANPPYLPLASRHDVLVFQTEPLAEDTEVTGPIEVRLYIESTAPDTDFTAKLIDVYPPSADYPEGYALNLTDSIMRMRYRDSWTHPELMRQGAVHPVTITLYPTSNLFKAGHRIRLDVSSSNFPRFDVNPNTGEHIGMHTHTQVAENTVHHSAAHPSHVVLPVIPAE
ncbi:MAG: CocE/NonD family hydrolase [Chloroflexi bacterium]|nr:CocE/NonD family hydrolase [Chloroflexota bacterium]